MSSEVELLRLLKKRDNYDKYARFVKEYTLFPEAATLVSDVGEYFKYHPETTELDWPTFSNWFRINKHPGWKTDQHKVYAAIIENIAVSDKTDPSIVNRFIELDAATQINDHVQKIFSEADTGGLDKIRDVMVEFDSSRELATSTTAMVDVDAASLFTKVWKPGEGLEWRLEDLNRCVGPVRRGDLIMIGKRPEVGGTTFVTSEFTHMVKQLPEGQRAIIFNNEERGEKVGVRLIQSALGCTVSDIMADPAVSQSDYITAIRNRRIDVYHDVGLSTSDVERVLRTGHYSLIAINILDKVSGFHKLEGVERLRALSVWTRQLADKYGVVFVVAQADASAEGVRYLDQSQLYGSKTVMQADSDVQLMIGKDNNPGYEDMRYFSVVRNKTPGGPRTDPKMRHGKFECAFDGERARFESVTWK